MTEGSAPAVTSNADRPDYSTSIAFAVMVIIGGSIGVAIRISNMDLPPFWGAGIRAAVAALAFWLIIVVRRIDLPRGRESAGALLYGLLTVGFSYALLYWGLLRVQAGLASVVLAVVPLMTLLFALAHGLESFRWRGLAGSLIAIFGILLAVGEGLGTSIPVASLLALIAGAACLAEGSVLFKFFPQPHPHATNALALTIGASFLLGLSLIVGEDWHLPTTADTWIAFIYLVIFATVGLYYLYLFVLSRWPASVTNYSFLLFPISTVVIAAWLLGEIITTSFVIGSALVLVGVWLGALRGPTQEASIDERSKSAEEVPS
jgi:drug/metabolite transporter (DMT)-like permease